MLTEKESKVISYLEELKEGAKNRLQKFKEDLGVNPVYAFKWADATIEAVQQLSLCADLEVLINNYGLEETKKLLNREIVFRAATPAASTSPSSNYTEIMYLKVRADFYEHIQNYMQY